MIHHPNHTYSRSHYHLPFHSCSCSSTIHGLHSGCTLFFPYLMPRPLLWMFEPIYVSSYTLTVTPPIRLEFDASPSHSHTSSVLCLLTFILLLSTTYLHLTRLSSPCSLLSLQIGCRHHSLPALLPGLIFQPLHQDCKQERGTEPNPDIILPPP